MPRPGSFEPHRMHGEMGQAYARASRCFQARGKRRPGQLQARGWCGVADETTPGAMGLASDNRRDDGVAHRCGGPLHIGVARGDVCLNRCGDAVGLDLEPVV